MGAACRSTAPVGLAGTLRAPYTAPVLRVIAALRQVHDRGSSCTLSIHCYVIYGACGKGLSMEKQPCSGELGVYDWRCPQHSQCVRSDAGMGFLTHVGISGVIE